MQSVRPHRLRGNLAVIAMGALLVGYIAFLLIANYKSQIELQKSGSEKMRLDTEKQADAIGYFFFEQKDYLKNLVEKREISAFYENKALGMSVEYGLRYSLFGISKVFDLFLEKRRLAGEKTYTGITFLESDGTELVDRAVDKDNPGQANLDLKKFLDPGNPEQKILVERQGSFCQIMISTPYFFKGAFAGQVIATISADTVYRHLIKTTLGASKRLENIVTAKGELLFLPADWSHEGEIWGSPDLKELCASVPGQVQRFRWGRENSSKVDMVAIRVPIPDTPFFLVVVEPAADLLGHNSPHHLLAVLAILSLAILGGVAVIVRGNTRNLVLQARLQEAAERGQAVEDKNRQLEQEIGERQLAEQALQESEAQYRLLAENVIDVIWTMDLNWKFTYASPSCERLSGYNDKEIVGLHLDQLLTPDSMDLCKKTLADLLSADNLGRQDYPHFLLPQLELRFKDGSKSVYIEVNGSIITDSQGQPEGLMGVTRDITDRKQLEEQFLQAQKMEAVGTLAGGIAHDFNNILMAILGNISLAVRDEEISPQVQDRLIQAEKACLRAQALSQQLLAFAKGGMPVKKIFSVAEPLIESTAFTCAGSPVKCETSFPENLWLIEADPGQIVQVIQNLTINAIQAMPAGGTNKIWAENFTLGSGSDLPLSPGRYIKISVRDQGMGIPAEHLPRIFDPYFTTKRKGSGLGLASAFAIIKNHHGHIAVESKLGVGTTFTIYLPAVERQINPQPKEDRGLLAGKGKILVMDDEEMVREVLGKMFPLLGYEAEFAGDGSEAIEMFVQAQGIGQAFAAVILDLTVPGGMGGRETMAELLKIDTQVKAIVSSGYSDDPIMADFQKYGFSGVIAKPYRIVELGKLLYEVIMGKL
ncbi:MAG: PAS domain S-box protein [Syntrophobacterales bacterium]|jgi:PAS domain S-box-containing protein|nr:PAS domain S-box protein [Syntrophobacterales bacterium]